MRIKKKLVKLGSLILLIVTVGTSLYIYKYNKVKEEAINLVKSQTSEINPDINFDKAYSKYLIDLNYTFYKDSQGNEIVSVKGRRFIRDRNKICDIEIQYLVDNNMNKLHFYKGLIDNSEMNELEAYILKVKAYSTYDSTEI